MIARFLWVLTALSLAVSLGLMSGACTEELMGCSCDAGTEFCLTRLNYNNNDRSSASMCTAAPTTCSASGLACECVIADPEYAACTCAVNDSGVVAVQCQD